MFIRVVFIHNRRKGVKLFYITGDRQKPDVFEINCTLLFYTEIVMEYTKWLVITCNLKKKPSDTVASILIQFEAKPSCAFRLRRCRHG